MDAEIVVDAECFGLVGSEGNGRGEVDAGQGVVADGHVGGIGVVLGRLVCFLVIYVCGLRTGFEIWLTYSVRCSRESLWFVKGHTRVGEIHIEILSLLGFQY